MAIERLETRIAHSRIKWKLMKDLLAKEEIDEYAYLAIERCVEILSQTVIDISTWSTRYFNLEQPGTNKEIILQMKKLDIFKEDFIDRLSNIGGLRNILVHEYTSINRESIIGSAKILLDDFPYFSDEILKYIKTGQAAYGLRIKKLHKRIYESRINIHLRIAYFKGKEIVKFFCLGDHDDIKHCLKNLK